MFCVTIGNIVNTILKNERVVLCGETAAAYLGLSNGWGIPVNFYTTNSNIINSNYLQGHVIDDIEDLEIVEINDISCTTEEQTICDLILNDCDEQTILESMSNYYYKHNNSFDSLLQKAIEFDIIQQLL